MDTIWGSVGFTEAMVLVVGLTACTTNLRERSIPDLVTLGGACAAFAFHTLADGGRGFMYAATACGAAIIFFSVPLALGALRIAELKLIASIAAWLGPFATLWLAAGVAIVGGGIAVVAIVAQGRVRATLHRARPLLQDLWNPNAPPIELSVSPRGAPRLTHTASIMLAALIALWLR